MARNYATFYNAREPCPICGRYKTAYKNKCFGFITSDNKYAYCSREEPTPEQWEAGSKTMNIFGNTVWRHKL